MALIVTQEPYEVLVRMRNKVITGMHAKLLTVITDDTGVQPTQYIEGEAQGVALTVGGVGFPLLDIMTEVQIASLGATTAAQAAQVVAEKAQADSEAAEAAAKVTSDAAIAALTAQVSALTAALDSAKAALTAFQTPVVAT